MPLFSRISSDSKVYGQGKLSILKRLEKSKAAREKTDVFLQKDRTPEAIWEAGIRIFVKLYGRKNPAWWTDLRYLKYIKMVSSSATIKPVSLPPAERAMFYAYRVYFCSGKQCSCHSNGLKYVADCGGCRETECQNGVTSELIVEGRNDMEDGFDNNIFDNIFGL